MAAQTLIALPPSTIKLIGSGQVITSVYSVVKELVENSIDAGCTSLDIKLEGYGLQKIEVSDNGCGIKREDVAYMAKRHYTSKLVTVDDLQSLETYGFRGEALASLCAVSNVTITTKTSEDDVSYMYDIDAEGDIKEKKPSHHVTGTTVSACNLFNNLPVRKQFYNTSQRKKDDLKRIEDLLYTFGIIRPYMRITLKHDRSILWQKMSVKDTKGALQSVLSREVANQLICVDSGLEEIQGAVCAYVPKPGSDVKVMSRSAPDRTFIVVNQRPVHMKELVRVLKQYYVNCHSCDVARYPICYVVINLPASDVDVNVEPNKTSVILQHLKEVQTCFEELLLKVYGPLDNVPSWHYTEAMESSKRHNNEENSSGKNQQAVVKHGVKRPSLSEIPFSNINKHGHGVSDIHNKNQIDCSNNTSNENMNKSQKLLTRLALNSNSGDHVRKKCTMAMVENALKMCISKAAEYSNMGPPTASGEQGTQQASLLDYSEDTTSNISKQSDSTFLVDLNKAKTADSTFLVDLNKEKTATGSLIGFSTSESMNKQSPVGDQQLDTSEQLPCLKSHTDIAGCSTISVQMGKDSGRPEASTNSWSMGHVVSSSGDKQLQPVQILSKPLVQKRPLSPTSSSSEGLCKQIKTSAKAPAPGVTAKMIEKKTLKRRLYHLERKLECDVKDLRVAMLRKNTEPYRIFYENLTVIGQANSCDAWLCGCADKLCMINVHRLGEAVLYRNLRDKYRLPSGSWPYPLSLNARLTKENLWTTLEQLAIVSQTPDHCFQINDERLVANGFDIQCHRDSGGLLQASLAGLCDLVPSYSVRDLSEVLEAIRRNPSVTLAECRPAKVLYYLRGEVFRILYQNVKKTTKSEIQDLTDQLKDVPVLAACIHQRPVFHELFDLKVLNCESLSPSENN